MLRLVPTLLVPSIVVAVLLGLSQDRLIYYPARYLKPVDELPSPIQPIRFRTSAGEQTAFYIPPRTMPMSRLWIVFGGNGMTALAWTDWVAHEPDLSAAYLLVDYPGFGYSEGSPSRKRINEVGDTAFATLAASLGLDPDSLAATTCVQGHSIGAAVGLEFAVRHPVRGILLTAPFTKLADIASYHYGVWVRPLLRKQWDNVARLAELKLRRPSLTIVHGEGDDLIPISFGRQLAQGAPWARFVAIPGAHHNDIYEIAAIPLREAASKVCADPTLPP